VTLVVSIKSAFGLVVAADGMSYYGHGDADVPNAVQKVKVVRSTDWLFSFSGQGTAETLFQTIQASIENGSLTLDPDIRIAVLQFFEAFDFHLAGNFSSSLLLAGFDLEGAPHVYVRETKQGATNVAGDVFALGAQHSTAIWLVQTLLKQASSLDDVAFLAYFAIEQVAGQELKVGDSDKYRIDVCSVTSGTVPKFVTESELQSFAVRSRELLARMQQAFQGEAHGSPKLLRS
jgi:20S proteasome alpha/beta subunit